MAKVVAGQHPMPLSSRTLEGLVDITEEQREGGRQSRITDRSVILADVARELLQEDAGAGLIQAALRCWEYEYGREAALILTRTALLGVSGELERR